jgi:hypothetical protein
MPSLPESTGSAWRKSSRSQASGECVEIAGGLDAVRDSKNPASTVLAVGAAGLRAFLSSVKEPDQQRGITHVQ